MQHAAASCNNASADHKQTAAAEANINRQRQAEQGSGLKLAAAVRNGGDSLWGRQVERQAGADTGGGRQRRVEAGRGR